MVIEQPVIEVGVSIRHGCRLEQINECILSKNWPLRQTWYINIARVFDIYIAYTFNVFISLISNSASEIYI